MQPDEHDLRYYGIDDEPRERQELPDWLTPGTPQTDWTLALVMVALVIILVTWVGAAP